MHEPLELLRSIEAEQKAYAADLETKPLAEANKHKDRIRSLRAELSASVTAGANPCSVCGHNPLGIYHPEPVFDDGTSPKHRRSRRLSHEIRCVPCVRKTGDEKRFLARSTSQSAVVSEWNALNGGK